MPRKFEDGWRVRMPEGEFWKLDRELAEGMKCPTCDRQAVYMPYAGPRGEYIAVAECPLGHWEVEF